MMHSEGWRKPRRRPWAVLLISALAAGFCLSQSGRAADLDKRDSSLKLIPADAAFYSTMLRTGEQIDAVAKSKAWAKLMAMPGIKQLRQMAEAHLKQPDNPQVAAVLQLYRQPENQQLVALLKDMISQEVFCYGGESLNGFLDLMAKLQGGSRLQGVASRLQGGATAVNAQIGAVLQTLAENQELLKFPDFVIGFKLSKAEPAEAQLKRLEQFLNNLEQQLPPNLKGRIKRAKAAGGDFLTLTLDGSLVPWQMIPIKNFEEKEGEFDKLQKKLKELKLTISLGIRDNYMLMAFGESTAGLAKLGGGGQMLSERPEFKPLAAHAAERITSIGYVSKALRSRTGMKKEDLEHLADMADDLLKKADLPAELQARIKKDAANLAKDLKPFIPEVGASLSFAFLTDRGQEGYSYDWTENLGEDGSKPLTLLNHVGGSPILAIAGRSKYSPENYQLLVKWLKVGYGYFEDIAVPKFSDQEKAVYEQVSKIALPLLERVDKVTGGEFLPALADGQAAFVLDAKLESKQWHPQMPAADKPLPLLEPALVLGVSDAAKLKKAMSEYREIVNDLLKELHNLNPQIPDFQIPEPETQKTKAGTLYFYPLPQELELDKQIAPNAGLSDNVAVAAISLSHSERLLGKMPLAVKGGPLADLNKPRVSAVYLDWAGLITKLSPWVEFGVQTALAHHGGEGGDAKEGLTPEAILGQVRTGLEILMCFRSYSSSTYFEDKARVTHSETVIKDID